MGDEREISNDTHMYLPPVRTFLVQENHDEAGTLSALQEFVLGCAEEGEVMTLFCLAPIILAGYAGTIQTDWHTSADISGPYAEAQTCKDGFGARVAFGEKFVQVGPQFGYTIPLGDDWSVTLQAHGGMGYSNTHHPNTGVRQVTKWNGGLAVLLTVDRCSLKVGYDHMSNGRGIDPTNAGIDFITTGVGYSF